MRWGTVIVAIFAFWIAGSDLASAEDFPVAVTREAGVLRVEGVLPGPLLDLTVHRDTENGNGLVLLVRPFTPADPANDCADEEGGSPLQLWQLTPPGGGGPTENRNGRLALLRDDVDPRARTIHSLALDGSGNPTLVTVTPGALLGWPSGGKLQRLLVHPDLQPRAARFSRTLTPQRELLVLSGLGRARFYASGHSGRGWHELIAIDLPKTVRPGGRGLRLDSRPPVAIGKSDGAMHFATPPIAFSSQRLSGQSVDVAGDEAKHFEWWAGLPGEEEVLESDFVIFDGAPALMVTTRPSRKLGLFGEKRLRLFRLREDRSRMGHPPFFAVQSRINLWQAAKPYARDVDGDGRDDLVLAYWKGLKDDRVVLDVYSGREGGSLARNPHTTAFDVKDADRTFIDFAGDVDGDQVSDLLLRTRHRLLVFSGSGGAKRDRAIVGTRPAYDVLLSKSGDAAVGEAEIVISVGGDGVHSREAVGGPPRPRLVDLDRDGRNEVVNLAPLADGSLRLTWLRFGD